MRHRTRHDKKLASRPAGGIRRRRGQRPPAAGSNHHLPQAPVNPLEEELLTLFRREQGELSLADIMESLHLGHHERKELLILLADLGRRQLVTSSGKRLYQLAAGQDLVEGTVEMHPRGFGFAIIQTAGQGQAPRPKTGDRQDPFIAPENLATAHHGDRVLLQLFKRGRGRQEARVVRVLERAASRVVGIYMAGRAQGLVTPEDDRLLFNVLVRKEHSCGARDGFAVVVEIGAFKPGQRNPEGRIVEVLGDPASIDVETEMVIRKRGLPHQFSAETVEQVAALTEDLTLTPDRADLRDVLHITIDGETARDFDDAVAVDKTTRGFRLYVSIADVSHYVQPDTPLDRDAYQRGTSVYFPTRVVPMLPERLSNDLCSLVPDQDRLTFTAILEFDRTGKRLSSKFTRSIIRSRYRMTYTKVKKIVVDQDKELRKEYRLLLTPLKRMAELAAALEQRRQARGRIGFEIPEPEIAIGPDDQISAVNRSARNLAHKMIEEFMLAANEAVAEALSENHRPTLYRIHETPDQAKVLEFTHFARSLGLGISTDTGSPQWFGKILKLVAGSPKEYIINNLLLRTMQRARYSPDNVGHFGLAATYYTHFTSPIRRYPDLMVHRALAGLAAAKAPRSKAKKTEALPASPTADLTAAGDFLSTRERVAVEADREMTERLQARFMADKIGESFEAVVSGVSAFGLYVELLEWFISGAVSMTKLKGDYFQFDTKNHRLVGANTGKIYQIGDLVRVRLASVEPRQRRINFAIDELRPAIADT